MTTENKLTNKDKLFNSYRMADMICKYEILFFSYPLVQLAIERWQNKKKIETKS